MSDRASGGDKLENDRAFDLMHMFICMFSNNVHIRVSIRQKSLSTCRRQQKTLDKKGSKLPFSIKVVSLSVTLHPAPFLPSKKDAS